MLFRVCGSEIAVSTAGIKGLLLMELGVMCVLLDRAAYRKSIAKRIVYRAQKHVRWLMFALLLLIMTSALIVGLLVPSARRLGLDFASLLFCCCFDLLPPSWLMLASSCFV